MDCNRLTTPKVLVSVAAIIVGIYLILVKKTVD